MIGGEFGGDLAYLGLCPTLGAFDRLRITGSAWGRGFTPGTLAEARCFGVPGVFGRTTIPLQVWAEVDFLDGELWGRVRVALNLDAILLSLPKPVMERARAIYKGGEWREVICHARVAHALRQ